MIAGFKTFCSVSDFFSPNTSAAAEKILLLEWLYYQQFIKKKTQTIKINSNKNKHFWGPDIITWFFKRKKKAMFRIFHVKNM